MNWFEFKAMHHVESLLERCPVMLRLYPTSNCNNSCYYCSNQGLRAEMDIGLANRIIAKFYEAGGKTVLLSGGEPTTYKHWRDLIKIINSYQLDWAFFTNGYLLQLALMYLTPDIAPSWVRVSIDAGSSEEIYRKVHGCQIFSVNDDIWKKLSWAIRAFPQTVFGTSFVICSKNVTEIMSFAEKSKEVGAKYCRFTFVRAGKKEREYLLRNEDELEIMLHQVEERFSDDDFQVMVLWNRKKLTYPKETTERCWYSDAVITVGPNGCLYPCCLHLFDRSSVIRRFGEGEIDFRHNVPMSQCPKCDKIEKNVWIQGLVDTARELGWRAGHYNFL